MLCKEIGYSLGFWLKEHGESEEGGEKTGTIHITLIIIYSCFRYNLINYLM